MKNPIFKVAAALGIGALSTPLYAQNFTSDVIVQGSLCVGIDCSNGESFGFDTIRLKENNLRIRAQDTSNSASFPTVDWQITFNETSNGGANKFSIDDIDNNRTPFTIEASAPSNSLYVDDGGRVGMGTATPVVEAHVVNGDSPTLRLEQNGSSGFTPQTFDIAANESNFFVRDVTNGSQLPFKIVPGADTNSLVIAANNNIGLGTISPDADLHTIGSLLISDTDSGVGADTVLHVRNNAASGNQTMLKVENTQGRPRIELLGAGNAAQTGNWSMSGGSTFVFQDRTNGDNELILDQSGNLTILGTLTEGSDRNRKTGIEPVDQNDILQKVRALPVSYWTYKQDADKGIRHIGPMAQDFYAAFGTGATDLGISNLDSSGVALAAIQALASENTELKARLSELERQIEN
ncbi:hypothetical protein GCM10007385_44210 [Tateyamaria omphalii]|uniref:tail fiber domain-containing protein n=1 Tax=Tateyamaria omphalii TaxID=299262 RepID=UPI00167BA76C|nr:tail fiber domain-containing protein [Tateyamaria omphalii]GGX70364.1 hypothetical protein GCM10007385_44210 [Tateyamaria omphalii]